MSQERPGGGEHGAARVEGGRRQRQQQPEEEVAVGEVRAHGGHRLRRVTLELAVLHRENGGRRVGGGHTRAEICGGGTLLERGFGPSGV